jgi:hypothetical protein
MRRREFIAGLGSGAAAWPLAARAQPGNDRMRLVGLLFEEGIGSYWRELQALGWTEPFASRPIRPTPTIPN